ncbi:transaldolase [Acinetobacter nosocomialis]|uniref:transaldolase n=1 Tax=Acinetobacter nosocomialis TaxID=106654 RepID=UPI00057CADB2|nr:transaldolase [Acinetobacter nosocomialis]AJB47975.1 transaldolase [Acinetobacter nosocomialis]MBR7740480.1 transaldolase [Acinetobacter nosocomialis]MBR7751404.1 transaldolase [Acinetobacter nosocomialis]MDC9814690.1 transaldolase [Acinetobacter nosocomialis]MDE1704108.1 transaldolase [Acinetobacter nosocomialis]
MTHTALDQLKTLTTVVADSSDLDAIRKFRPLDATTNPSLITAAAEQPESKELIEDAYYQAKEEGYKNDELIERTIDILTVKFGVEILKLIEGRVSTEVDAALSYDTEATIQKAHELCELYKGYGIDQSRILIKIASTWEGIQAAKVLEAEGIACNLTLLFGLHQAQACADAKVTLISPFVGRILDWYKKAEGVDAYPIEKDPGVVSVKKIYTYYKQQNIPTQVMGASFRSIDQVLGLAGCDLLTISPGLLTQLEQDTRAVKAALDATQAKQAEAIVRPTQNEQSFKDELNHDLMAFQLLQGGVDGFIKARDQLSLLLRQSFGIDAEIKS